MNGFWGDLPTWITTLAVGFAAIQLRQSHRSQVKEDERLRRAQASGVWAWAGSFRGDENNEYGFVAVNSSPAPIRNVKVGLSLHGREIESELLQILPPGEYFVKRDSDTWDYPLSLAEYGKPVRPYAQSPRYLVHWMEFEDAAGTAWRYSSGRGLEPARA
ncbi:hypothetical protein ACFWHR_15200 [Leucobacter sp. NPDC058333]|uniref:hypothetical protein n=1 Tax=Leucobacter sp. NPDC058333 TaxID=3346450 RepID=UPI00365DAF14